MVIGFEIYGYMCKEGHDLLKLICGIKEGTDPHRNAYYVRALQTISCRMITAQGLGVLRALRHKTTMDNNEYPESGKLLYSQRSMESVENDIESDSDDSDDEEDDFRPLSQFQGNAVLQGFELDE